VAVQEASNDQARRRSPIERLRSLIEDVRAEINKITWPSRTETRNLTIVVIGISLFIGGLLGVFDLIMVQLIKLFTSLAG
jgi:preprotein translocase subunit SecE